MPKIDDDELEILDAYEKGQLESVATSAEVAKLEVAARATAFKDRSKPFGVSLIQFFDSTNRRGASADFLTDSES